jgi:hypothetical protein
MNRPRPPADGRYAVASDRLIEGNHVMTENEDIRPLESEEIDAVEGGAQQFVARPEVVIAIIAILIG